MRCSLKCGLEVKPTLQHLMSRTRNKVSRWSFHSQKFDDEGQLRIRRDRAGVAALAVGEVGGDDELALAADLHAGDALVPALDDLPGAELEGERAAAVEAA